MSRASSRSRFTQALALACVLFFHTLQHVLRVVGWLLTSHSLLHAPSVVCSPALSDMGCLRKRDLWRRCTCHPNNGVRPREFDSCGNRLGLDELRRHSLRGPVCAKGNERLRSCIVVSRYLPPSALTPASTSAACGYEPHGQWAPLDADTPALIDRSARLVEPCVADRVFLLFPSWCWPHQARLAPSPRSPLANAHREALLKVLSLV